jgi:hypothetical protein
MGFGRWYNAQKAGVQIAVAGGIVVMVGGIVAGVLGIVEAGLARPGAPTSTPTPALTTSASALVTSSPLATAASTPPSTAAPTGTITDPHNGATNVSKNEELLVSGTAQNMPAGYRLDVFLQYAGHLRYYAAANPDNPAPLINGHWSAAILIGEAQPIIVWLVVLSPADMSVTNNELRDQSAGYPTLPGTRLASVRFTANAAP